MAVIKLNASAIHTLKCPEDKSRAEFCDSDTRGLYLLVSDKGQRTFFWRTKIDGKTTHRKIGRISEITLADARAEVNRLKEVQLFSAGQGNLSVDVMKKASMTMNDLWDEYLPYAKSTKRSWKRDEQLYRLRILPRFGHLKLADISVKQIQTLMMDIRKEGLSGASADHHGQLMRRMGTLAVKWGYLDVNFARGIELYHEFNQVDNVPSDTKMQRLMDVLRTDRNRPICLIVQFLLSTGCRLNEALSAQWMHVSIEKKLWSVPMESSKSKRPRHIPLNDSVLNVLQQINRKETDTYVFTNAKTNKRFVNIFKPWSRIRSEAGLPNLTLHTLRHTYATYCINAGCTLFEVQNLLGHQDGRVTQRYAHLSTESMLTAANSVSEKLSGFTKPRLEIVQSEKIA